MIDDHFLQPHHVADGDHRKSHSVRLACRGVDRAGTCAAFAAAEHVGADDEIFFRIESLGRTDHVFPPTARPCGMRIAAERMDDEDRIRFRGIQCAVSFVCRIDRRNSFAAIECNGWKANYLCFTRHRQGVDVPMIARGLGLFSYG